MSCIRAAGPADLIAYVWYGLGVRPRESLVAVGLHGPRRRAGSVARVDLPGHPADRSRAARHLLDLLRLEDGDGCVLLVATDAVDDRLRPRPGSDSGWLAAAEAVEAALADAGIDPLDVLLVGPASFGSLRCPGGSCCPDEGVPLSEVESSRVATAQVLAGHRVADDEDEVVADADPRTADRLGEPALDVPARRPGRGRRAEAYRRWLADLDAAAQRPTRPGELLAALCADLGLRDAVLLSLLDGGRDAGWLLVRGRPLPARLAPALDAPADEAVAATGDRLLAHLARRAPAGRRADPLAALAWLAWVTGDGTRARLLAGRALDDRPGHRLAGLVEALLAAPVPPPRALASARARGGGSFDDDRVPGPADAPEG